MRHWGSVFFFSFPFLEILPYGIEIIGPARWQKAGAVELQSSNENVQINFKSSCVSFKSAWSCCECCYLSICDPAVLLSLSCVQTDHYLESYHAPPFTGAIASCRDLPFRDLGYVTYVCLVMSVPGDHRYTCLGGAELSIQ